MHLWQTDIDNGIIFITLVAPEVLKYYIDFWRNTKFERKQKQRKKINIKKNKHKSKKKIENEVEQVNREKQP